MNWISITDRLPDNSHVIAVYRTASTAGYEPGYYIAYFMGMEGMKSKLFFCIKDREHNMSNYRPIDEFSHWMPLPSKPE